MNINEAQLRVLLEAENTNPDFIEYLAGLDGESTLDIENLNEPEEVRYLNVGTDGPRIQLVSRIFRRAFFANL